MKIMPVSQPSIQKKPAFGTLHHKSMQPFVQEFNIAELKDYKKAAQSLDGTSDDVNFNVFIQPITEKSSFYGKGDILVAFQPKDKSARYPEAFYSFDAFRANFPEIMEDTQTKIARAARRLNSEYLNTTYKKIGPSERGGQND